MNKLKKILKKLLPANFLIRLIDKYRDLSDLNFILILYFKGIYPFNKKSPDRFINFISTKNHKAQQEKIRQFSLLIKRKNKHDIFEKTIQNLIPNWALEFKEKTFTGKGTNPNTINATRKIRIGTNLFFEKVYFTQQYEFQTLIWFNENIYSHLNKHVKIPKVKMLFKGELVSIVYFEFLNLKGLKKEKWELALMAFAITLYQSSPLILQSLVKIKIPKNILDYSLNEKYREAIKFIDSVLKRSDYDLEKIKDSISSSKHVLTHNDLNRANAFQNNVLIDWDGFGIYPIGLEQSYMYIDFHYHRNTIVHYDQWLEEYWKPHITPNDWFVFYRNFCYFLLAISNHHIDQRFMRELKKDLLIQIRKSF